jgi:hypothetical protein
MPDILFEPKFKNVYTLTEVIKTDKFILVIDDDLQSYKFDDILDYYEKQFENMWAYSVDLIYLDPMKIMIAKYILKMK